MKPTILIGDRVFINKLAYGLKIPYTTYHLLRWSNPARGDIVVFYSPKDGNRLIKRVIGLPGDEIALFQKRIVINGKPMQYALLDSNTINRMSFDPEYHYFYLLENLAGIQHPVMISGSQTLLDSFDPIVVPEGMFFVMGDNRDNSADSRVFGFVEGRQILGRAVAIALSRDGSFLNPRWARFFKKLN